MDSTAASFPGVLLRSIDAVAAAQSPATDSAVTIRLRHAEASIKLEAIEPGMEKKRRHPSLPPGNASHSRVPGSSAVLAALDIERTTEWCRGATRHVLFSSHASIVLQFPDTDSKRARARRSPLADRASLAASATFSGHLSRVCGPDRPQSAFERRTEDISAKQYFQVGFRRRRRFLRTGVVTGVFVFCLVLRLLVAAAKHDARGGRRRVFPLTSALRDVSLLGFHSHVDVPESFSAEHRRLQRQGKRRYCSSCAEVTQTSFFLSFF